MPPPEWDMRAVTRAAHEAWADSVAFAQHLAGRAAPFASHAAVSAAAYTATLASAQGTAFMCRLSSVTPVAAPVLGFVSVGLASAAAGQASAALARWRRDGRAFDTARWKSLVQVDDLALDAIIGAALFMAMGGRFRSVLPSDVRFVGSLARESLPAAGSQYATDVQRAELRMLFRRYGCHHCGKRFGQVIADHQPPNKTVYGACAGSTAAAVAAAAADRVVKDNPVMAAGLELAAPNVSSFLKKLLGLNNKVKQRFFPQCGGCSSLQSDALRRNVKKLVTHFGGVQPYAYAGVLVGLRQYAPPQEGRGAQRGTTLDRWLTEVQAGRR